MDGLQLSRASAGGTVKMDGEMSETMLGNSHRTLRGLGQVTDVIRILIDKHLHFDGETSLFI